MATKPTKSQQTILDNLHTMAMGIGLSRVVFDVDAFPSETNYYVRDCGSSAFGCMAHTPGSLATYCVEYFGHDDGVIYTLKCDSPETMLHSLKWIQAVLADIRKRLDNLL